MPQEESEFPEKNTDPEERRKEERYPAEMKGKFRKIDPKDLSKADVTYHQGTIRDMSRSGMRLESDIFMPVGQPLEIFVDDKISGESFYGIVETVRSRKEIDFYDLGVRFVEKQKL